jgi:phage terminase large subunit-like protein
MFGLRQGKNPQALVTTTPRPIKLLKEIKALPSTVLTKCTTYANRDNLAPSFFSQIIAKYEGTRLGRQEILGEVLEDNPGALWNLTQIDNLRVAKAPQLARIVVAIDPAVTNNAESDETGIVVCGIGKADKHGYVLDDLSRVASPDAWGRAAVGAYFDYEADRIVAEVNQGGDLVEVLIRTVDQNVAYRAVRASKGKQSRAEPVAALYEQGRVHHVGTHAGLEDQMVQWDPVYAKASPDRVDALVWGLTDLMLVGQSSQGLMDYYQQLHLEQEAARLAGN